MTQELTQLMNKAVNCSEQRGYYRDTDKALQEIFEFYIEHKPHIAELTARRDIFRDINLPALVESQFVIRQLPDMLKRIAQLEHALERNHVTKPNLTKQVLPTATPQPAEDIQARAKQVMGDNYQAPAVNLFDYGD